MQYAPISKEYRQIMNKHVHEYPHFMDFILSSDVFDPSSMSEGKQSHLYDDVPHTLFRKNVKSLISGKRNLEKF